MLLGWARRMASTSLAMSSRASAEGFVKAMGNLGKRGKDFPALERRQK